MPIHRTDAPPMQRSEGAAQAAMLEADPFPKAPVLTFPVESASPGVTSLVNLLTASGTAAILLAADGAVKFISDTAKKLFEPKASEVTTLKSIEARIGLRIPGLAASFSAGAKIGAQNVLCSLVPLSGGAAGAVLVFRAAGLPEENASLGTYIYEAVFNPLRSLRETLASATTTDLAIAPLLGDAASTIEQVLSSLELAPGLEGFGKQQIPAVTEVVRQVAERFRPFGELKNVNLQLDVHDMPETFSDHESLSESLGILLDNAIHYVPAGGHIVTGVRWMEHKGKPLFLFFVMDTGPLVPERLREAIFDRDFVWNPNSPERTGRSLFKVRDFAMAHAGSVWADSRTGKACTFFLRVRPDSAS